LKQELHTHFPFLCYSGTTEKKVLNMCNSEMYKISAETEYSPLPCLYPLYIFKWRFQVTMQIVQRICINSRQLVVTGLMT